MDIALRRGDNERVEHRQPRANQGYNKINKYTKSVPYAGIVDHALYGIRHGEKGESAENQ